MKTMKNAIIICVGCKEWKKPKHILMETDAKEGELLDDIANRSFDKYKANHKEDVWLVHYTYFGDIQID